MEISRDRAFMSLRKSKSVFLELFKHGSRVVEFYKPGDFLFVKEGVEHRLEKFKKDFA